MFWATVGDGGTLAAKPGQVATKGGFVRFAHDGPNSSSRGIRLGAWLVVDIWSKPDRQTRIDTFRRFLHHTACSQPV
jgi:hypothetical protein